MPTGVYKRTAISKKATKIIDYRFKKVRKYYEC